MRARRRGRGVVPWTLLLASARLFALNPALEINQYAHHAWKNSDGFAKGPITSIAQTPDGYLWLGTDLGLIRFDGVRPVAWEELTSEQLPTNNIRKVLASRDGTLWIGMRNGLASWKDGKLTRYVELADQQVVRIFEDHEGTVWVGTFGSPTGKLCAIRTASVQCSGQDGRLGRFVSSLNEYQGFFWVGASTGLWRWKPNAPKVYPVPGPVVSINDLIEGDNGNLWLATNNGIRQLVDERTEPYPLPGVGQVLPYKLLRDRDGGLWIATLGQGLWHLHQGRTDVFTAADGLSSDQISYLFEDREGNIWAATLEGLDRFREFAVPTISARQGLAVTVSVLAAQDGNVWLGTNDGLSRWNHGEITTWRNPAGRSLPRSSQQRRAREIKDTGLPDNSLQSLFQDDRGRIWVSTLRGVAYFEEGRFTPVGSAPTTMVYSIAQGSARNLWIDDSKLGLFHLQDGRVVEHVALAKLGHEDEATTLAVDRSTGGVWVGFRRGGLVYLKDGEVRSSYGAAEGLSANYVLDLRLDSDGTLWAGTEGGLSRLKGGRIATLTSRNGLPCDSVRWSMEDDAHSLWMLLPCGLVTITRPELDAWAADPSRRVQAAVFDSSDGVRSFAGAIGLCPRASKSADGKLWFVNYPGVSVIDPLHLPVNTVPPPVQIEAVKADGKSYPATQGMRLPPRVRDVWIDYTALSLAAPEKVRFRYRLVGQDPEWKEVRNAREVQYTNLRPRHYRFLVQACNNSGVWNEAGASLDFSIDPKFYQTDWFYASCVAAFLAMLWGAYRLRMMYLAQQFNLRLEERVGERTRIARELHDTMLQSFQGVLLKFGALPYLLPDHSEVKNKLETCIEQARAAITEGREAVQGLRSSTVVANDLARAITTFGEGLAAVHAGTDCPEFRVYVEGNSKALPPVVRDEVYKIACECLRNAFRHAQARRIEVQIGYDPRQFRLQLVDNGKGIDPAVLSAGGRAGHHGLKGIHERATLAGGKLSVWSQAGSGTEIELTIPATIAYTKSPAQSPAMSAGPETGS